MRWPRVFGETPLVCFKAAVLGIQTCPQSSLMGIKLHCMLILMAGTTAFAHTVPENTAYEDRRSLVGRTRPALLVFSPFVLAGAVVLLAWNARGRRLRSASSIAPSITESRAGPK